MWETSPAGAARTDRPRILCVDDEPVVLAMLHGMLKDKFEVQIATTGAEALAHLSKEPAWYSVVISDMQMPLMDGAVFLREARRVAPDATRILLTGHADLESAVNAVNEGQLYRFLTKPCRADALLGICTSASEEHRLKAAERLLLEQTLKGSVKALAEVLALASPAAFGRSARVRDHVTRLARAFGVAEPWELEVAALLVHIGAVTLPSATAEKLYAGSQLTPEETSMVKRIPQVTHRILENIPRLEGVIEILDTYLRPYDDVGAGRSLPLGARILRIAVDYETLEAQGADDDVALDALRGRALTYDPDLIDVFSRVVGTGEHQHTVLEIPLSMLLAGMRFVGDVRSQTGALLIARGHTATDQLIERLDNLGRDAIREPLLVVDLADPTGSISSPRPRGPRAC